MTKSFTKSVLGAAIIAAVSMGSAMAADVPAGVTLAKEQKLVRNNGAEPQSLDPHKIQGVPEANLARDQFEGLVNIDANGDIYPGVAESGRMMIIAFGVLIFVKMQNGLMAIL